MADEVMIRNDQSLMLRDEGDDMSGYERGMFLPCHIGGLIPAKSAWLDGRRYFVYALNGWESLEERAAGHDLTDRDVMAVKETLHDLRERLPMYLLKAEHLLLKPESVFINRDGRAAFLYKPGGGTEDTPASFLMALDRLRQSCESDPTPAMTEWESYRSYAEEQDDDTARCDRGDADKAVPDRDMQTTARESPRRRLVDRYTILVTLFLVGVVLAVFMILQTGVLDQILNSLPFVF